MFMQRDGKMGEVATDADAFLMALRCGAVVARVLVAKADPLMRIVADRLHTPASIPQRAAVLARIGTAGQRALVPVDPDRLSAAERPDHAGGLVPELLEAF